MENFNFIKYNESLSYSDVPYPHFPQYNTSMTVFILPIPPLVALYDICKDHY